MIRFSVCLLICLATTLLPARVSAEPVYAITSTNALLRFDSTAPGTISSTQSISGLAAGETLVGIDFRPANRQLYLLGASRIYQLNPLTGTATQVGSDGSFALSGTAFGMDFNPVVDRLRLTSNADQNLRVNPNDGTLAGTDTLLAYDATTADGDPIDPNAGADPNIVGSAYTNNFPGTLTTTLYGIDSNLDILVTQVPPNSGTLNTVGSLGLDVSDLVGFDISGQTGIAYASLQSGGTFGLYSISLTTGAASLVGSIDDGATTVTGITVATPAPSALLLLATGLPLALVLCAIRRTCTVRR